MAVGSIVAKAQEVCATANTDQPFMCLDLTYIAVLLKDGYGLNMKTNIKVSHNRNSFFLPENPLYLKITKLISISALQTNKWPRNIVGIRLCL